MPYITQGARVWFDDVVDKVADLPDSVGEVNYVITKVVDAWFRRNPSYQAINDVIGVLDCAKAEFYRRVAVPYEDQKIADNGDVYSH